MSWCLPVIWNCISPVISEAEEGLFTHPMAMLAPILSYRSRTEFSFAETGARAQWAAVRVLHAGGEALIPNPTWTPELSGAVHQHRTRSRPPKNPRCGPTTQPPIPSLILTLSPYSAALLPVQCSQAIPSMSRGACKVRDLTHGSCVQSMWSAHVQLTPVLPCRHCLRKYVSSYTSVHRVIFINLVLYVYTSHSLVFCP